LLVTSLLPAQAPPWDAINQARGWSRIDVTGACAFHDPASQTLQLWSQDASLSGAISVQRLPSPPERFFFDARNQAWIAAGTTLYYLDRNGKVLDTTRLPAEVADLAWDGRFFYVTYKAAQLFVEKRDMKSGASVWSYGNKPNEDTRTPVAFHRIALSDDGTKVLVASGSTLDLTALDVASGKTATPIKLAPTPPLPTMLHLGDQGRLPLHTWPGRPSVVFAATTADLNQSGDAVLHLVKADLEAGKLIQQNTGLKTDHTFIGILDSQAVFTKPTGGMVMIPLL